MEVREGSPLQVVTYTADWERRWDELVERSHCATFLHSRRFLSYHGDRFRDASLLFLRGDELIAVLPAAVDPADSRRIVSHPGATYGGLVPAPQLKGETVIAALDAAVRHYAGQGFGQLHYKTLPHLYHVDPSEADRYALFRSGARWARCDLSASIDLAARGPVSERRRRALRKAHQAGVQVGKGVHFAADIWSVVTETLQDRHGVCPVHSLEEIKALHARFPDRIRFLAGLCGNVVVAGAVLFDAERAVHVQYSVAGEQGRAVAALDAVLEHAIDGATAAGKRYFDFGISTEEGGHRLNDGLLRYKQEFGAGMCTYDHYVVDLKEAVDER